MKLLSSLLISIALVAAACGGSDDADSSSRSTTTTQATASEATTTAAAAPTPDDEALSAGIGASFTGGDGSLLAEEEACIGNGTIAALGIERLTALGVTEANAAAFDPATIPDMTEDERDVLLDVAGSCVDIRQVIADSFGEGDAALAACAYDALSADDASAIIRAGMNPDLDAGFDTMVDLFSKANGCLDSESVGLGTDDPQELAAAIANAGDDGTGVPTAEENLCVGEGVVASIGQDRLAEVGLTVATAESFDPAESSLTEPERDAYVDVIAGCLDLRQFLLDVLLQFVAEPTCLSETLTDDDAWRYARTFLAPVDSPEFETPADIQAKLDACPL